MSNQTKIVQAVLSPKGTSVVLHPEDYQSLMEGKELLVKIVAGQPVLTIRSPVTGYSGSDGKQVVSKASKGPKPAPSSAPRPDSGRGSSGRGGRGGRGGPSVASKPKQHFSDPQVDKPSQRFISRMTELAQFGLDAPVLNLDSSATLSELQQVVNQYVSLDTAGKILGKDSVWKKYLREYGGLAEVARWELEQLASSGGKYVRSPNGSVSEGEEETKEVEKELLPNEGTPQKKTVSFAEGPSSLKAAAQAASEGNSSST